MLSKHLLHVMLHQLDHRVDMFKCDLGVPHFLCSSGKFIPGFWYWQVLTKQVFEYIPYVLNRVKVW